MTSNNYNAIPLAMKERNNWVVWQKEKQDGKDRKVPYQISHRKARADVTNPNTWTEFGLADICADYYSGIGYVLDGNGIVCIDLDNCLYLSTGTANKTAAHIVETMASYTEISQSGRGLHIFGTVNADIISCIGNGKRHDGLEVYANKRYIAVTGNVYGNHTELADISKPLSLLLKKYFTDIGKSDSRLNKADSHTGKQAAQRLTKIEPLTESDKALIDKARRCDSTGQAFSSLFDKGDISAYNYNHSRADWHLVCILRYWTNGNRAAMMRIFAASALARKEKGLSERLDYIPRTITNALAKWKGNGYRYSTRA